MRIEPLGPERSAESWRLSRLAFGGDPDAEPPPPGPARGDAWGASDDRGRLLGKVVLLDHVQWWGGREVPAGGVASVAVHPDARGSGLASRLLRHATEAMRERGQPLSALFPTVLPLYRSLGWEVAGAVVETRLATRDLATIEPARSCSVRTAEADRDLDAVRELYDDWARRSPAALTRRGRAFPEPAAFDCDVVGLAQDADGTPRGYLSYDRGRGYRGGEGELHVWELVSQDVDATRALLASLSRWHPVAATTLWRGPTDVLELLTGALVPPPATRQPWMLRVVDPVSAVAARGFPDGVRVEQPLQVTDPESGAPRSYVLAVQDGRGALEPATAGGVQVHVRGLALLYAGLPTAAVAAAGLLERPLPALDAAFAGPAPVLLDYF